MWPEKLQSFESLLIPGNVLLVDVLIQNRNRGLSLQANAVYGYDRETETVIGFKKTKNATLSPLGKKNQTSQKNNIESFNQMDNRSNKSSGLDIYIDETNDVIADKRRLSRIFNLINEKNGNVPVYLHINSLNGDKESLFACNTFVEASLIRDIKILLGALGEIIYDQDAKSSSLSAI